MLRGNARRWGSRLAEKWVMAKGQVEIRQQATRDSVSPRAHQWVGNLSPTGKHGKKNPNPTILMPLKIKGLLVLVGQADWVFKQRPLCPSPFLFYMNVQTQAWKKDWGQWPLQVNTMAFTGIEKEKRFLKISHRCSSLSFGKNEISYNVYKQKRM